MARLLLTFLLTTLSLCTFAQSPTSFDVRKVRWWMTKAQVMQAEAGRKPVEQSRERLAYKNVKVGDDYANLLYEFHSNKLISLTYTFTKLGGFIPYVSYGAIDRKVTDRYGEPVKATEKWRGDKNAYEEIVGYSDAIAKGDLVMLTLWASGRTEITHVMNSETHGLLYESRLTPKPASEETKDF